MLNRLCIQKINDNWSRVWSRGSGDKHRDSMILLKRFFNNFWNVWNIVSTFPTSDNFNFNSLDSSFFREFTLLSRVHSVLFLPPESPLYGCTTKCTFTYCMLPREFSTRFSSFDSLRHTTYPPPQRLRRGGT